MALASGTSLYPGSLATLFYRPDVTPYPYAGVGALPVAAGATFAAWFDMPETVEEEGSKNGYGNGTQEPLYDLAGLREYELSSTFKIADVGFLAYCLGKNWATASSEFGTPDFQLLYGAGITATTYASPAASAYLDVLRYAKVANISLNWQEGSAEELKANISFQALAKQNLVLSRVVGPTDSTAFGSPLTWHNLTAFTIAGVNYRDQVAGISFSKNYNLERKVVGTDLGDNIAGSRTSMALMPHHSTYSFEMTLHSPALADTLVNFAANSTAGWGPIIITASDATRTLTLNFANARLKRKSLHGGDTNGQMGCTVTATVRGLTTTVSPVPSL